MKSFEAHFAWSKLVTEEFFRQGDTERQFGLPLSPLCDRHNCKFEKNQIGFLEFVVLPLYSAVNEVLALTHFDRVLDRIQQNTAIWKRKAEQAEQQSAGFNGSSPSTTIGHMVPKHASHCAIKELSREDETDGKSDSSLRILVVDNSSHAELRVPEVITPK